MTSSNIPTLDASDLAYWFEVAIIEGVPPERIIEYVRKKVSIPPNLQYIDSFRDPATGTSGVAFKDTKTGKVIVAYTGTNPNEGADFPKDALTDGASIGLGLGYHYQPAYHFYSQMRKKYGANNIVLTGHSLGGNVAQRVAIKYNAPNTVVYNAAPLYIQFLANQLDIPSNSSMSVPFIKAILAFVKNVNISSTKNDLKNFTGRITRITTTKDPLNIVSDFVAGTYVGTEHIIDHSGGHSLAPIIKDFRQTKQISRILMNYQFKDLATRKKQYTSGGLTATEKIYLDSEQARIAVSGMTILLDSMIASTDLLIKKANKEAFELYNNLAPEWTLNYLSQADALACYHEMGLNYRSIIEEISSLAETKKQAVQTLVTDFKTMEKKIQNGIEKKVEEDAVLAQLFGR